MSRWFNQAVDYLRKAKKSGKISHWELDLSDTSRGMFGVRVSKSAPSGNLFEAKVSATYRGRDLRSAAERAVNEIQQRERRMKQ